MSRQRKYTFDGEPIYLLGERSTEHFGEIKVQDFYDLRQQCLQSKTLFEDSEFPATNESLFYSHTSDDLYEWLRPSQICKNPQFCVKGYSRFDIRQGDLYDCWFLAAVANLTLNDKLFTRVVPDDNLFGENYAGIFHFRFWSFGKWVDVVIDDRLPTFKGKLVFNRSVDKNEFWSALFEKAYAKLYGSYEALTGGNTSEAFEDFTGGISERYHLKEPPSNLFEVLLKAYENGSLFGCSIDPDNSRMELQTQEGLIKGHAYSITKVQYVDVSTPKVSGKIPLLRLRNPWGDDIEWNGPWSDKSPQWSCIPQDQKTSMGLTFDNDGEFWMSFSDFRKYFDNLEICNLSPSNVLEDEKLNSANKWTLNIFEGKWISGVSAGGCNDQEKFHYNPQYILELNNDHESNDGTCSAVISLIQKNRRNKRKLGLELLTIGFKIYKLTANDLIQKPLKMNFFKSNVSIERSTFINIRTITSRYRFKPGNYLIVPATIRSEEDGEFMIRVFTHSKNKIDEHDEIIGVGDIDERIKQNVQLENYSSDQWLKIEKLFLALADDNKEIGWTVLKKLMDTLFLDVYQWMPNKISDDTIIENERNSHGVEQTKTENQQVEQNVFFGVCWTFCCGSSKSRDNLSCVLFDDAPNQKVKETDNSKISKDFCRSMVAMLDFNRSGKLDLAEFKNLLNEIFKWKAAFKLYDKDNNNKLDSYELRDALASTGYRLNNSVLGSLLYRFGLPDNTMTLDDFIMCAIKVRTMLNRFYEKNLLSKENLAVFTLDEWFANTTYC